jgi:hypothetical protein
VFSQICSTPVAAASIAAATALICSSLSREAQSQRKLQVFHRPQNLRCSAAAVGAAGLGHASKKGIHRPTVGIEESSALRGNLVQLLGTIAGADRHVAKLLKVGQRWIDDARTGAIGTGDLLLYLFDNLVPVPGLLGDQVQDDQAKVAVSEEASEAPSPSLPPVPVMTEMLAALAVLCAAEAAAMIVMGVSMVHWFSECVST